MEDASLYVAGLALLEQNLHTLDTHGLLDAQPFDKMMMEAREPLEWQFKQLDQAVGLSFKSKFHFALVGHLLKGFRHQNTNTVARSIRLLNILLGIVAKCEKRDKFQVTVTSAPYLAALVSVSEEVRCRCHLRYHHNENTFVVSTTSTSNSTNTNNTSNSNSNSNNKSKSQTPVTPTVQSPTSQPSQSTNIKINGTNATTTSGAPAWVKEIMLWRGFFH